MEKTPEKESQSDILIRLRRQSKLICDEQEKPYAAVEIGGHTELMDMGKERFRDFLTREFFLETGRAPSLEAMNQALGTLKALAKFEGPKRRLKKRVAALKGTIYYDLADKQWRAVRIAPDGCRILEKSPLLFLRNTNMKAQVEPDLANGDMMLLKKHLRLRRSTDWILCAVYIVTCLIPTIPHPILIIAGEKGAAKSTTLRMLKTIIDPSTRDLLVMPNAIGSKGTFFLLLYARACWSKMTVKEASIITFTAYEKLPRQVRFNLLVTREFHDTPQLSHIKYSLVISTVTSLRI
ncbi:hypothetical protein [Pelotomaculum propionicicum]|uniref:Uncharacterized protein n=1 Tax=Pelotomaculum propionicicum TaxID=258475 RepID=A0A4Y7RPD0_9FIRM|nr:hypothetical protein [Pelotomaculum propionicicum]NLI13822.1 hypothetical protein [Peptococcaceae bacterium]TEB10864.1 hypothetical protein Pmgp_02031 [Pelotomaculum propionicicum]